jgi:phage-related protein (TIGR01555 family)
MATSDGFVNLVQRSGYGGGNTLSAGSYIPVLLTRNRVKLEQMYRGSWIVGVAVDAIPSDMIRAGIAIHSEDEPSDIAKLQRELVRLGIWSALRMNLQWGRLYGGSLALIDIDGQDTASPLDPGTVRKGQFNGLRVYDRWSLAPDTNDLIPSGPDAGMPAYYTLTTMDAGTGSPSAVNGVRFHHSRVIRSVGITLPFWQAITENLWGESILERLQDRLVAFDTASMGAANLLEKAYLRTVQIDGLREIIAAGGQAEANLTKTLDGMRLMQGIEGMTLLDAKDTFAAHSYSFSGIDDVVLQFAQQLAGAIGVPMSRLFGQAPKGLNATGEGDMKIYHENISAAQELQLRNGVTRILDITYRSLFGRPTPETMSFEFKPLSGMDDTARVNLASTAATTIIAAFEADVIDHATAMRELQALGPITGVFTNVTDEAVAAADEEEPPMPERPVGPVGPVGPIAEEPAVPSGGEPVAPAEPESEGQDGEQPEQPDQQD